MFGDEAEVHRPTAATGYRLEDAVVHGISPLDAAGHWSDGTTSASDGQGFAMPQKVLQRTYSTRFFALEFYSFVADNYAPFYSRTGRVHRPRRALRARRRGSTTRATSNLEEQYTDTHGYTEIKLRRLRDGRYAVLPPNP